MLHQIVVLQRSNHAATPKSMSVASKCTYVQPPVPPLSDLLGTHQRSKNAKLGGLLRKIHMSAKFEKRGSILA